MASQSYNNVVTLCLLRYQRKREETGMISTIRKFGNSAGVLLPKPVLTDAGVAAGDAVEMRVEAGRIVIERAVGDPRAGWAEDARRVAQAGDDEPVWPDFANRDDGELTW